MISAHFLEFSHENNPISGYCLYILSIYLGFINFGSEIQWNPVKAGQPVPYLRIGKANDSSPEFCMKTNLLENRMFFWNTLPLRENQYAHHSNVHDVVYVMLWPIKYPFRNYWK